jgi:hypothetical protein
MNTPITITPEEAKAIRSIKRLAKKWPQSIRLFSWAGSLVVTKANNEDVQSVIAYVEGIPNDGGDPGDAGDSDMGIDTDPELIWPT